MGAMGFAGDAVGWGVDLEVTVRIVEEGGSH